MTDHIIEGVLERLEQLVTEHGKGKMATASRAAGLSPTTLEATIRRRTLPSGKTLVTLAEAIGVSPTWLLLGRGPRELHALADTTPRHRPKFRVVTLVVPDGEGDVECASQWHSLEQPYTHVVENHGRRPHLRPMLHAPRSGDEDASGDVDAGYDEGEETGENDSGNGPTSRTCPPPIFCRIFRTPQKAV